MDIDKVVVNNRVKLNKKEREVPKAGFDFVCLGCNESFDHNDMYRVLGTMSECCSTECFNLRIINAIQ